MAVRKLDTGKWICECYLAGRSGRRVHKLFATKGEALAFERHTMDETEGNVSIPAKLSPRTCSQFCVRITNPVINRFLPFVIEFYIKIRTHNGD